MPRTDPIRIVIADEQPIFRDGLRRLLEVEPGFRIVGETGDASEAVSMVCALTPDVLLLGLGGTGRLRLETLQRISAAGTSVRIILLTASVDTPDVIRAFRLGVSGVVPKDAEADALFKSIDSVVAGRQWIGRDGVSDVEASLRALGAARRRTKAFGLTPRELDIVRAVVRGETNKAIARRFAISENTVKRHLSHIFNKLGASNRVELALFAAHHRLLDGI